MACHLFAAEQLLELTLNNFQFDAAENTPMIYSHLIQQISNKEIYSKMSSAA